MEKLQSPAKDWPLGTLLWFAVLVWFSSSLLSQSAYMAVHGLPYDAVSMLKSLGPVYYLVLAIELGIWGGMVVMGWMKFRRLRSRREVPNPLPN